MNLDQVTLEIRPRNAWEAVDLGLQMARRWWKSLLSVSLITAFPILIIALLLPADKWWLSALILWWLKPIYERPLLHILSRAVFNDLPSITTTFRQLPSFAFKQLFLSLTLRRLSPTRSMDLPVLQLEGLTGARRKERLDVLHRDDSAPAGWISTLGLALEICLWFGLMMLVWAFIPQEFSVEWAGLFFDDSAELMGLKIIAWYLALSLSAPFYTACGFALYLNRRIKLEAWDVEIAFRRLANKRKPNHTATPIIVAVAIFSLAAFSNAPRTAHAQDVLPNAVDTTIHMDDDSESIKPIQSISTTLGRSAAQDAIKAILQQEEFSRKEIQRSIKQDDEPDWEFWRKLFDRLNNVKGLTAAASLLEIVLWFVALGLVAFVFYRYRHWLMAQFVRVNPSRAERKKPETLFGMQVTEESLPTNISQSALDLLNAGDSRAALALLYRASLFELIRQGVEIRDGTTEGECVQLMREHAVTRNAKVIKTFSISQSDYFYQLTRCWQQLAYGHLAPAPAMTAHLCEAWSSCWRPAQPLRGGLQ